MLSIVILFAVSAGTEAQTTKKKNAKKTAVVKKATEAPTNNKNQTGKVVLSSEQNYAAKSSQAIDASTPSVNTSQLRIADPVLTAFSDKARGLTDIRSTEIVGTAKHAWGFKNGRIRLSPSSSTSSGGTTGLGGVATGNSLGAIGASSSMPTVNGKSPDAGSAMWGNSRGLVKDW